MESRYLDFEKPLEAIEREIERLKHQKRSGVADTQVEITGLQKKLAEMTRSIFGSLTPWQQVQLARHPNRPQCMDYVEALMEEFLELHGDRIFGDDPAMVSGVGKRQGITVAVVGQQKGRDIKERVHRNFGSAHPEGYRKALRIMKLAEKFGFPVISFIDTQGAHPDVAAEERGQARVIAENLLEMALLKAPILAIVIGEGGSGGALGIGVGDRVLMQEHAIYSVISPEGCAAILWKDQKAAPDAAGALKLTAASLLQLGVVDEIIPEPLGGAHRKWDEAARLLGEVLDRHLNELQLIPRDDLAEMRYAKYRKMGFFETQETKPAER